MGFSYTPKKNLAKPDAGTPGADWGPALNQNFDTIDNFVTSADISNAMNNHLSAPDPHPQYCLLKGCLVYQNVGQSIPNNVETPLIFQAEDYDDSDIHDNTTNPERLTVPLGVTRVRLLGYVVTQPDSTGARFVYFRKNGASFPGNPRIWEYASADPYTTIQIVSPILSVQGGDYFTLCLTQSTGSALNTYVDTDWKSWFAMEIIR
jgi:hypothetical protein